MARFYLRPDRLSIVLVGNAAAFTSQLRGVGFGTFEIVEHGGARSDGRRLQAAGRAGRAAGPAAAAAAGRPQRLAYRPQTALAGAERAARLSRAAPMRAGRGRQRPGAARPGDAAKGGLDTLRAIKTPDASTTLSDLPSPNGVVAAEGDDLAGVSGSGAGRDRAARRDDRAGLRRHPRVDQGSARRPRRARARRRAICESRLRRDTIAVLLAAHDGEVRARAAAGRQGRQRHAAIARSNCRAPTLEPMVLSIDPETGLIAKQTYVAGGVGQPLIEELFTDYKAGRRRSDRLHRQRGARSAARQVLERQRPRTLDRSTDRRLDARALLHDRPAPS